MKILVTGAAGFIGSKIAHLLAERGDEVVGIDNINDYYDVRLKYGRLNYLLGVGEGYIDLEWNKAYKSTKYPNLRFYRTAIDDKEALDNLFAFEKPDKVVNLAAQAGVRYSITNPYAYLQSNLVGFLNILEACRFHPVKHLLFASSSSVYGMNTKAPFKETDVVTTPVSLYAATKKGNELMAHSYAKLYGIPCTGVRYFTVYGPWGRPDMSPMLFADAISHDKPIKVFNHGDMIRDFTYIDDIANGSIMILDKPPLSSGRGAGGEATSPLPTGEGRGEATSPLPTGEGRGEASSPLPTGEGSGERLVPYTIYNIGCSHAVKLLDYIHEIELAFGKDAKKEMLPMQPGDVYMTNADTTKLETEIGYKPKVLLHEGISKFIDWYKSDLNPLR